MALLDVFMSGLRAGAVDEGVFDHAQQGRLVALDRQQIVAALVADAMGGDAVVGGLVAQNVTENNYLRHAEAKELAELKTRELLGKCDSNCLEDIQRLETLDDQRNRELEGCDGVATSACDTVRQAVRSAAAEYLRANDQTQLSRLVDDYAIEQGETLLLAQSTMDDVLLGKVQGYTDAVVDGLVSAASAAYTGFKALIQQDPQAQDQVREGAGAAYDYLKNPENWPYLLGALTPEAREELARAYEVGDGQAVGSLIGAAVAGLPIGGGFGAIKKIDNVLPAAKKLPKTVSDSINITDKGMAHVVERHTVNDVAKFAGKSKFNEDENLFDLIGSGASKEMVKQSNGYISRTWDVGRLIGFDRTTGRQTSVMTVITRSNGELVTAYPGNP